MKKPITQEQRDRKNKRERERYHAEKAAGIPRFTPEQKEKARESQKRSQEKHKDSVRERRRAYYLQNKEEILAARKAYYEKNRVDVLSRVSAYRSDNREKAIEANARWRENNKDKIYELNRNYRAAKRGAEGSHTKLDVERIYRLQGERCAACGEPVARSGKNRFHVDHIVALSRGGSNNPDNIQLLCRFCNLSKGPKDQFEWAKENGRLL